eukprot:TRINITY_DN25843_c0_g1_i1.p1 TRINITY_DN25843_c0_g1~~TRINITY_DN25843_c0_g1_i1.p1  ORF type:complete len:400 (+),score=43.60 TRINITY_DN25843_c0_g1_i1:23-1222(+)
MHGLRQRRQLGLPDLSLGDLKTAPLEEPLANLCKDFELEALLGTGTVARVRRVRRKADQQLFAAKCVTSADEELLDICREEYDVMATLSHQSIVGVLAYVVESSGVSLVMEYCSGGNLDELIKKRGSITRDEDTRCLLRQLLDGVDYMHRKRIVHRDLKPANLLLLDSACDRLKIADFNSAKCLSIRCTNRQSTGGQMLSHRCTPVYSAPELVLGWSWNERVDIWTSGMCLFYVLHGRLPFNAVLPEVRACFTQKELPVIEYDKISDDFKGLLALCLAVDMRDRPPALELLTHPAVTGRRCYSKNGVASPTRREDGDQRQSRRCWTVPDPACLAGSLVQVQAGYCSEGVDVAGDPRPTILTQLTQRKQETWEQSNCREGPSSSSSVCESVTARRVIVSL